MSRRVSRNSPLPIHAKLFAYTLGFGLADLVMITAHNGAF